MTSCILAVLAIAAGAAGPAPDAGLIDGDAAPAAIGKPGGVIDFTEDEGIAGGEEFTAAPPEPIEHESLMPDRYREKPDAGPVASPASPDAPRKRGCGGCATGTASGSPLLLLFALYAARMRSRLIGRLLVVALLVVAVGCGKKKSKDEQPEAKPVETDTPAVETNPDIVAASDQSGGVVMVPGLPPQPIVPAQEGVPRARGGDISVVGVTIGGDHIYFLDQRVGGVVRQPIAGGKAKVLGEFGSAMTWASAGSKSVYFIAGSTIKSVPVKGGKVADVSSRLANPRGIAADGDSVFVVYGQSFGSPATGPDGVVARFTADGKETKIAEQQAGPISVAADDAHVYWTVKGALMRAPKAGGDAEIVASLSTEYAWHLTLSDKHAYITVQGNAGTYLAQVAKADGAVKQLARLHNQPVDIANVGDTLYFTAESATPGVATLWSFNVADSKLTSVATGLTGKPFLEVNATHVAWASADTVYWLKYGETKPQTVKLEK